MRPIKNDKRAYQTRESLSSPPKALRTNKPDRKDFTFQVDGHYLVRRPKPTT